MKKSILKFIVLVAVSSTMVTGCSNSEQKVEKAEENVSEANKELDAANKEYLADIEAYKQETADQIAFNEKSIADFNVRVENEKKEAKADYKKKIAELEKRNSDLKMKMNDYKAEGKEKWESFKAEFKHDMNELGEAFKGLTIRNNK